MKIRKAANDGFGGRFRHHLSLVLLFLNFLNLRRLQRHYASRFLILDFDCSGSAGVVELRRVI